MTLPTQKLLEEIQMEDTHMVAVSQGDRIVGIVDLENTVELMRIYQAKGSRQHMKYRR